MTNSVTAAARLQEPPNSIQFTITEGCNLRCSFCAISSITEHAGQYNAYMSKEHAEVIAGRIAAAGWNPRLEFAQHGEPSMHPAYWEIIAIFRKHLPKAYIMVTSNGGGFLRSADGTVDQNITRLMEAGCNNLALDNYIAYKVVPKLLAQYSGPYPVYHYPQMKEASPHTRRPAHHHVITVLQDLTIADKGTHSYVNNHAGLAAPKNYRQAGKRCARPFREMSIRTDGNVTLCCVDWRGVHQCGNALNTPIEQIWNNVYFDAARRKLYLGQRDFGICDGCDVPSYRVGLLPDKFGKETMPPPTPETDAYIAEALGHGTLAPVVLRPWEIQEAQSSRARAKAETLFKGDANGKATATESTS